MSLTIDEIDNLYREIKSGSRVALGRAITLVESVNRNHRLAANRLLDLCAQDDESSAFRFAVSGSPGVGKSSFIEVLGKRITGTGQSLAVLAVDPSSRISGGSILGDKTRMETLSNDPDVFIRPMSAGEALGGVTDSTREVMALCEAAGYDNICIETVGVGQSEVAVRDMTDYLLLLVLPGGGDDLQGIKRGIVELADAIAINKSDGDQVKLAEATRLDYMRAAHLFQMRPHEQKVEVLNCSAFTGKGIDEIWESMLAFNEAITQSGYLMSLRSGQDIQWLEDKVSTFIRDLAFENEKITSEYERQKERVRDHEASVSSAYDAVVTVIRNKFSG